MKKRKNNDTIFASMNADEKKVSNTIKIISIVLIVILIFIVSIMGCFYAYVVTPIDINSEEKINFVVNQGDSVYAVIDRLEKAGLVRSAKLAKLYVKYNGVQTFYAGEYELSKAYPFDMTLNILCGINNAKTKSKPMLNIAQTKGAIAFSQIVL